jgi:hypothetical protein
MPAKSFIFATAALLGTAAAALLDSQAAVRSCKAETVGTATDCCLVSELKQDGKTKDGSLDCGELARAGKFKKAGWTVETQFRSGGNCQEACGVPSGAHGSCCTAYCPKGKACNKVV